MPHATMSRSLARPFIRATDVNANAGSPAIEGISLSNVDHMPTDAQKAIEGFLRESSDILCTQEGFQSLAARPFRTNDGQVHFVVFDAAKGDLHAADHIIPADAHKYQHIIFEPKDQS